MQPEVVKPPKEKKAPRAPKADGTGAKGSGKRVNLDGDEEEPEPAPVVHTLPSHGLDLRDDMATSDPRRRYLAQGAEEVLSAWG